MPDAQHCMSSRLQPYTFMKCHVALRSAKHAQSNNNVIKCDILPKEIHVSINDNIVKTK